MSPRITIGFVLAVAILAAIVMGLDRFNVGNPSGASGTPTADAQVNIFTFDDSQVKTFTDRNNDQTVEFDRDSNQVWSIAGSSDPPNTVSLQSLVIRMSQLQATRVVSPAGAAPDMSQYGLVTPGQEAQAQLNDGTTSYDLQIGSAAPVGGTGVYARTTSDDTVYLLANQFATDLSRLAQSPVQPPTPTPLPPTAVPSPSASTVPLPNTTPTP